MSAPAAYAAYLRNAAGAEPETVTGENTVTVTVRHQGSVLTVTFRPATGSRQGGWHPATIVLSRGGGSVAGYAVGQLANAVADLTGETGAQAVAGTG